MGRLFRSKVKGREVGSWKFKFQGRDISTGTKNKREAEDFQRQYLGKRRRPAKAKKDLTVADLLALVRSDYERRGLRTIGKLASLVRNIERELGSVKAHDIRAPTLNSYIDRRLADGMSPASVNRELEIVRRGFRIAVEQELLDRQPKVTMLQVRNVRNVDLTPEEHDRLVDELSEPVRLMFVLAYHIGWRAGRLLTLKWSQVDIEKDIIRAPANQSSNKWVGTAPIYGDLGKALLVARANHEKFWPHVPWVLHSAGVRLKTHRVEWERARKVVGRPDLRFHDVRHAAVTNMIEAGIAESRVMEIVGHSTQAMLRRYMISADRHVQEAGRKLDDYFARIKPRSTPGTVQ